MARRRHSKQSLRSARENGGTEFDHFTRSRSAEELSDDADLLEIGEAIVISSDEEKGEKERMTECSSDRSSLGSVAEINEQSSGEEENTDSVTESEPEVRNGDVNSTINKASVSVENRGEETKQEKREWQEKKAEEEDRDCCAETVHVVRDGVNMAGTIPVGWRTRSYTKNAKRVDYTAYYKNTVKCSDSEESGESEESDSESCTNSDSGSNKQRCPPEEKRKSGKYNTVKGSAHSLGTGTPGPLQRKGMQTQKGVEAPASSSDCSLDIDDVPNLERLNEMRKNYTNEEGCSRAPFEEFDVVSIPSSDDENEMVRKVRKRKRSTKKEQVHKSKYRKRRRREIHDKDLFDFLMRSPDEDGEEDLESSQHHLPRELPMVFNFRSDNEPLPEKSDFEKLVDEAWGDFDFALGVDNLGSYKPDEAISRRDAVYIATGNYCLNGEHEMHLDEQIGYKCCCCSYVETEIRDILPAFATQVRKAPAGRNQMNDNDIFTRGDLHEKPEMHEKPGSSYQKTGTVWDLLPGLIDTLYPHQKEAFDFMWQNIAGSIQLDELHSSVASQSDKLGGCVISHAPGTGKTRLAIVFIQSYMKKYPNCKPVVIAPANLLKTWDTEFKKWDFSLPFHDMNSEDFTGKEDRGPLDITSGRPPNMHTARMIKLFSWYKGNGVLGISYHLFNKYVSGKLNARSKEGNVLVEKPGLLILDEGHIPRNESSQLWNALCEVKTEKRIILSGTPFQNNFSELYNTLCLVRPAFVKNLSVQTEKPNREEYMLQKKKEKPIKDIWTTPTRNVTAANAEEVRAVLKPFVHVYNGEILKSLPGIRECVIILNPEVIQGEVLQKLGLAKNNSTFDRECKISLASIHPYLLKSANLTEREASLLDKAELKNLRDDPYAGVKMKFVIEFIRLLNSNPLEERVLIFSQYIIPLELIKKQLMRLFHWTEGSEVFQIHGKIPSKERERSITSFNDVNSKARVLLASTKACSEGISLIGASRVVLLDVVWNPSVGKQAIRRAFRIGQQRVVYTYNLITAGTDEMEKYDVQMQKDKLSKLVFSPKDIGASLRRGCVSGDEDACDSVPEDRVLEALTSSEKLKGMFAKIYYTKSDDWSDSV